MVGVGRIQTVTFGSGDADVSADRSGFNSPKLYRHSVAGKKFDLLKAIIGLGACCRIADAPPRIFAIDEGCQGILGRQGSC